MIVFTRLGFTSFPGCVGTTILTLLLFTIMMCEPFHLMIFKQPQGLAGVVLLRGAYSSDSRSWSYGVKREASYGVRGSLFDLSQDYSLHCFGR